MIRKNALRLFHRETLALAARIAWHNPILWCFALIAGLFQIGGIYDTILSAFDRLSFTLVHASPWWLARYGTLAGYRDYFSDFSSIRFINLTLGILLALVLFFVSSVAQGALVAGIGAVLRGRMIFARSILILALNKKLSLLIINALAWLFICFGKTLVFAPFVFVVRGSSWLSVVFAVIGVALFFIIAVIVTAFHLISLQMIMLEGANVWQAVHKFEALFKRSWVVIVEKAFLLGFIGICILALITIASFVASIPIYLLLFASFLFHWSGAAWIGFRFMTVITVFLFIAAAGFTVTFQYSAWHGLYMRAGEYSVISKFHRWLHWIENKFLRK